MRTEAAGDTGLRGRYGAGGFGKAEPVLDDFPRQETGDTIFLGYPDWWGTCPMCVFTFLERYDI